MLRMGAAEDRDLIVNLCATAQAGDFSAQFQLARRLAEGDGVVCDIEGALRWYGRAVTSGKGQHSGPEYSRLTLLLADAELPNSPSVSASWHEREAIRGQTEAERRAGVILFNAREYQRALVLFLRAAGRGDSAAQFNVGLMYEQARGVPRDFGIAAQWYSRAAEGGWPAAQRQLGRLYSMGRGVRRDWHQALRLFWMAAARGSWSAKVDLAYASFRGTGMARNPSEAYRLLDEAAAEVGWWRLINWKRTVILLGLAAVIAGALGGLALWLFGTPR